MLANKHRTKYGCLLIVPLLLVLVVMWGCEPEDPGSPLANQSPETRIVVAPLDSVNHDHFVSPSLTFRVQWFGHDPDGIIKGYWIQIDNGNEIWTVKGDSAIAFESSTPDPNDPTRMLDMHTIKVSAEDNEGLRDPTPAMRTFNAVNYAPELDRFVADFPDSAVVGAGIYFEVVWSDANVSGAMFRLTVDGFAITGWDARSKFQFCNTSDEDIVASIDIAEVLPVDVSLLYTEQMNTISVQVKDLGGAVGDAAALHVEVVDTVRPALVDFSALYGSNAFFPDGSSFYQSGRSTTLNMSGSAESYYGGIQSYRYRQRYRELSETEFPEWGDWSEWGESSVIFDELNLGSYQFEAQCRDFAGVMGDTLDYTLSIIEPDYEQRRILIVDETRDGNGNAGSPDDMQVDEFYRYILELTPLVIDISGEEPDTISWQTPDGWEVNEIDYIQHKINDASYISPLDVYDKQIIIWHADDRADVSLGDNVVLLGQYLDAGGKLIISGYDVLQAFTTDTLITFNSGFAYNYLRLAGGRKNGDKEFIGAIGNPDYNCPDLTTDADKLPNRWAGKLNTTWILYPEHRTEALSFWNGDPADTPFEGGIACLRNFSAVNPWRTITLGFPLFFTKDDEAKVFIKWAVSEIAGE